MTTWRWCDPEQTMATDDAGSFAPAGAEVLTRFVAGDAELGIAPGVIAPYRRFADLAEARAVRLAEIEARAGALRIAVAGTNDATKLAVYREKYAVAVAALGGDAAALAALAPEAAARGQSAAALAALVKALGDAWTAAGLAIDAAYQTHKATVQASTLEALEAYDVTAGWPS